MNLTAEDLLVGLSVKSNGEWEGVYKILKTKEPVSEEYVKDAISKTKTSYITMVDTNYPDSFKEIEHPPFVTYYYGDIDLLEAKRRIAVVGSDNPTDYQSYNTEKIVTEIAQKYGKDCVIVSDYEGELDAAALRTAMKAELPIIVVMSSGIDNPNDFEKHQDIYDYCKSGKGLIISEYPNDVSFDPDHRTFSARLVSGIAQTVLVMGGDGEHGNGIALQTADYAVRTGKKVLALRYPGLSTFLHDCVMADYLNIKSDGSISLDQLD